MSNETAVPTTAEGAVVPTQENAVTEKPKNYITLILENMKADFEAVNDGVEVDFVRMGEWLFVDKKGNFVDKAEKTEKGKGISYGDHIDIVIGQGEKRWSVWGAEKSPEEGQLIVAETKLEVAQAALSSWLESNPQAAERYSLESLELRYMCMVVPVASLGPDNDFPDVYIMGFSPTATYAFGNYTMAIFKGKFKGIDIPARTGVAKIVTRLTTSEKQGAGSTSYIGIDFDAVGLFKPEEYGINAEA
ncbi:MAG: hypothetical protein NHB14_20890 [Desulfosporosinus sp.]|nr:hypothetical protein [Desulfosporosinus sp.]